MSKSNNAKSFWELELFPKYLKIYNETNSEWVDHLLINIYTDVEKSYIESKNTYKKNHNKFFYYFFCCVILPLSFLLLIPAYFTYKKYKNLKSTKDKLLNDINKAANEKLKVHLDIVSKIDVIGIINSFKDIIKYEHQGPIPYKLIDEMQNLSLFDISQYNENTNPYSTSWGIFDNKIVIHAGRQIHHTFNKEYTGSKTISYTDIDSDGNTVYKSDVVTATYTHPAHDVINSRKTFSFMESCSELEFCFAGKNNLLFRNKHNKKNNYSPLENSDFEKKFKWYRNNDVQFRMIFTPYAQEKFLEELGKDKDVPIELQWEKTASFIYNDFETVVFDYVIERNIALTINEFLINPDQNLELLKESIFNSITNYYFNLYKNMNYMFLTTIMSSENHKTIIDVVQRSKEKIKESSNYFFAHNILNEFLNEIIISGSLKCFNTLVDSKSKILNDINVIQTTMQGLNYDIVRKTIYIPTYSAFAGRTVDVPVDYDDYIPKEANGYLTYFYIDTDKYFYKIHGFGYKNNIDNQELLNMLMKLSSFNFLLKNKVFAIYSNEPFENYDLLSNIISELNSKKIDNSLN